MILSIIGITLGIIAIVLGFWNKKDNNMSANLLEGDTKNIEQAFMALQKEFTEYQVFNERKREEFEAAKLQLLMNGWIEGEIDEAQYTDEELEKIEFIYFYDANGQKIDFYREIKDDKKDIETPKTTSEPITPIEPPTTPELPNITPDALSEIVKKAVKEVKNEIKRKKRK